MSDMTFDQKMIQAAQDSIIKQIASGDWLKVDWGARMNIPAADLRRVYDSIDMADVIDRIKARVSDRLADAIFNAMATEIATDVKKIMSNTELREDLRAVFREKIREAAGGAP